MAAPPSPPPADRGSRGAPRVPIAFLTNVFAPYRLHLYRRVAAEVPEVRPYALLTHVQPDSPWSVHMPPGVETADFAAGPVPVGWLDVARRAPEEWATGGRIARWLRDRGVRAVVMDGYNDAARLRVLAWCRRHRVACFLWGDSNIRGERVRLGTGARRQMKVALKRAALGALLRRFTGLLPCGSLGREFFVKYGADPARTFYMPLEPDYDQIARLPSEAVESAARRFGLAPGRRRIVYSGRLIPLKRLDLVIDAFAAIAPRRPEWDLVIVGDGPQRAEWEARVPPSLRGRVIWTGFLAEQEQVSAVYRACDVLVLASEQDAWALVVNEAAAAGLAIVSSDVVGASAELVRDGVNGRLFPSGDLAALTDAFFEVTDPARIDAMKAASPKVLEEWRRRADPVEGLRRALRFGGVLPPN